MASINLHDVCLDYPLYGAYDFSLKRRLLGRLAGASAPIQTIRAIDNISIKLPPARGSVSPAPTAPANRHCCG